MRGASARVKSLRPATACHLPRPARGTPTRALTAETRDTAIGPGPTWLRRASLHAHEV
jgi:hypothetical protein